MIKIFHMYQTKVWYSITDFWNRVCCVLCYRHTWGVTYNACPIQYIKMYLYTVTYTKSQHTHTPTHTHTHTHPHTQPLIPLWQNRVMEVNILRWVCVLWRIVGCKHSFGIRESYEFIMSVAEQMRRTSSLAWLWVILNNYFNAQCWIITICSHNLFHLK